MTTMTSDSFRKVELADKISKLELEIKNEAARKLLKQAKELLAETYESRYDERIDQTKELLNRTEALIEQAERIAAVHRI